MDVTVMLSWSFFSVNKLPVFLLKTLHKAVIWNSSAIKLRQGNRTWLVRHIVLFRELLPSDRSPVLFLSPNHKLNSHPKQSNICCLQEKTCLTGKFTKWTSAFSTDELHMLHWRWISEFLLAHAFWLQIVVHLAYSSHTLLQ